MLRCAPMSLYGYPLLQFFALALGLAQVGAPEPYAVVDLHVDLSYQVNYKLRPLAEASGQVVASRLVDAGVVGLVLPLYVPHEISAEGPRYVDLERSYSNMLGQLGMTTPYLVPGAAPEPGHIATWFAFEGAAPFAGRPDAVKVWVAHGVKLWGLVHAHDNALATSAGLGPRRLKHKTGLTPAGHELVGAIHAAGGIVDVSHASDRTIADVLEHAERDAVPVVATHSNADHLAHHARNLTDQQLRAIAHTNGLIGVNFHGNFLARDRPATLDDVVGQIQYMVERVGVSHVGIGADFEGGIRPPPPLRDVRGYQALANALRKAGFSERDVRAIFSGNALRILQRVAPPSGP